MKNKFTGKQYPRTCPLIRHADVIQLLCSQDRIAGINKELARLQAERLKPVPQPMTTTEILKEGFRKYFGVSVIELKASEVAI